MQYMITDDCELDGFQRITLNTSASLTEKHNPHDPLHLTSAHNHTCLPGKCVNRGSLPWFNGMQISMLEKHRSRYSGPKQKKMHNIGINMAIFHISLVLSLSLPSLSGEWPRWQVNNQHDGRHYAKTRTLSHGDNNPKDTQNTLPFQTGRKKRGRDHQRQKKN